MEREKRRKIALIVVIILVIVFAILFFIWQNFLNKGTISIIGRAPFSVEISGIRRVECEISPCEISQKIGKKDIIITKEGYLPLIEELDFKLWQKNDFFIEFTIVPFLTKVDRIAPKEKTQNYILKYNELKKMQKLIIEGDPQERSIVYFKNSLENTKIFSGENAALIIENKEGKITTYKIDIRNKKRNQISKIDFEIKEGEWSKNGKYFSFIKKDSPNIWILNEKNILIELSLPVVNSSYSWTNQNSLLFITGQSVETNSAVIGKSKFQYINILENISTFGYTVGQYHPDEDLYTKITTLSEIKSKATNIIPAGNLNFIYFQVGDNNYKLNIR